MKFTEIQHGHLSKQKHFLPYISKTEPANKSVIFNYYELNK